VKWKTELISVIVQVEKKTVEKEKDMKEMEDQLAHERDTHIDAAMEAVKLKQCTLDVSPVSRVCNQSGTIVLAQIVLLNLWK